MEDLVQWLRAQLDEDEGLTRAAIFQGDGHWRQEDAERYEGRIVDETMNVVVYGEGTLSGEQAEHIVRHDPARVLREIDAKRGIVDRYEFACNEAARLDIDEEERESRVRVAAAFESCVLCLAVVYTDRPGYLESWRP